MEMNRMLYNEYYERMFEMVRLAQELIRDAEEIAEYINTKEGEYYGDPTYTPFVLERYFQYYSHKDIEEYWESSSATC